MPSADIGEPHKIPFYQCAKCSWHDDRPTTAFQATDVATCAHRVCRSMPTHSAGGCGLRRVHLTQVNTPARRRPPPPAAAQQGVWRGEGVGGQWQSAREGYSYRHRRPLGYRGRKPVRTSQGLQTSSLFVGSNTKTTHRGKKTNTTITRLVESQTSPLCKQNIGLYCSVFGGETTNSPQRLVFIDKRRSQCRQFLFGSQRKPGRLNVDRWSISKLFRTHLVGQLYVLETTSSIIFVRKNFVHWQQIVNFYVKKKIFLRVLKLFFMNETSEKYMRTIHR